MNSKNLIRAQCRWHSVDKSPSPNRFVSVHSFEIHHRTSKWWFPSSESPFGFVHFIFHVRFHGEYSRKFLDLRESRWLMGSCFFAWLKYYAKNPRWNSIPHLEKDNLCIFKMSRCNFFDPAGLGADCVWLDLHLRHGFSTTEETMVRHTHKLCVNLARVGSRITDVTGIRG